MRGDELKKHVKNTVGPWARRKLDALERYLEAYHRLMQKQRFKPIYIDAFAGASWSRVRTQHADAPSLDLTIDDEQAAAEEEFIAGSPVRALVTGRGLTTIFSSMPTSAALRSSSNSRRSIRGRESGSKPAMQTRVCRSLPRIFTRSVALVA